MKHNDKVSRGARSISTPRATTFSFPHRLTQTKHRSKAQEVYNPNSNALHAIRAVVIAQIACKRCGCCSRTPKALPFCIDYSQAIMVNTLG